MTTLENLIQQINALSPNEKQKLLQHLQNDTEHQPIETPPKRIIGLHAHLGSGWMSDDFDDELPDSFWLGNDK